MSLNPYTLYLANCRDGSSELAKMYCLAQRQASLDYLNFLNLYQNGTNYLQYPKANNSAITSKSNVSEMVNNLNAVVLPNHNLSVPDLFYGSKITASSVKNAGSEPYKKLRLSSSDSTQHSSPNEYYNRDTEISNMTAQGDNIKNSNSGNTYYRNDDNVNIKIETSRDQNTRVTSLLKEEIKEEYKDDEEVKQEEHVYMKVENKEDATTKRANPFVENIKNETRVNKKNQNTEAKKPSKKSSKVKIQSKWKNIPGRIISGVQRACRHYFAKNSGIKLDCVTNVLEAKGSSTQEKFSDFIRKYKTSWKTWSSIARYVFNEGDEETTEILLELIKAILSSENEFEIWLSQTKMSDVTKTHIRASRDQFQYEFMDRLVSQSEGKHSK